MKLFDTLTVLPFCLIAQKTRENKRIRDDHKKINISTTIKLIQTFPLGTKMVPNKTLTPFNYSTISSEKIHNFSSGYSTNSLYKPNTTLKKSEKTKERPVQFG